MTELAAAFLSKWVKENVNAVAYPKRVEEGQQLASKCITDASAAGIGQTELEDAASRDMIGYMFFAMEEAADAEADRLAAKDD